MKKVFYPFVLLLAASIIFTGCRDDEQGDGSQTINSPRFTTTSPWTSSVRETTPTRSTAEATASTRSTVDWLAFSPQSGGAGTHTITITIEPNRTGAERSAVITIESQELDIEIGVTQRYVPDSNGDLLSVGLLEEARITPEDIKNVVNRIRYFVNETQTFYELLDNQFPTLTSRMQYLTPQTPAVLQFWQRSYQAIRAAYAFFSAMKNELERRPSANVKRAFLEHQGEVLASKGLMYFYLNTKFGGVPTEWYNLSYQPARATWSEVSEFVRTILHEAIPLLECDEKIAKCWRVLALIALQKEEYQQAMGYLQQSIGVLSGIHILTYLLYAETHLKIGQNSQAVARVNQVLQAAGRQLLPTNATDDEVFAAIKANFPDEDTGMKYINAVRWGMWGAEFDPPMSPEFRKFLPIPPSALSGNPNMVQNPGW